MDAQALQTRHGSQTQQCIFVVHISHALAGSFIAPQVGKKKHRLNNSGISSSGYVHTTLAWCLLCRASTVTTVRRGLPVWLKDLTLSIKT